MSLARPELVDTHCHLLCGELAAHPEAAWERARAAGVAQAIVVGIDAQTSRACLEFAGRHAGLFATAGIHPNDTAAAGPGDLEEIERLSREPLVVAVGESGMDLYRDASSSKVQRASLEAHAEIALASGVPLVLHVRQAFVEVAEALAGYVPRGLKAVVHCFTGGPEDLEPFRSWGFRFSFSGIVTFPAAGRLRQALTEVPRELLLAETDAPWLAPEPHRGATNEPAFVADTVRCLAGIRGESYEATAALTTANARAFFRLPSGH
jgi:TatD DNase family protein